MMPWLGSRGGHSVRKGGRESKRDRPSEILLVLLLELDSSAPQASPHGWERRYFIGSGERPCGFDEE